MDHSKKRPALPTSTPATVAPNRNSAYTCMQKPRFEVEPHISSGGSLKSLRSSLSASSDSVDLFSKEIPNDGDSLSQFNKSKSGASLSDSVRIDSQEKYIHKLIEGLPYNIRENISATLRMMSVTAENYQKNLELSTSEISRLRAALKKKSQEMELQSKSCDIYKEKLRNLENNLDSLKDNLDVRQKFSVKNKRVIDRLASTNRMLIDSLDALQPNQERSHSAEGSSSSSLSSRPNLLKPIPTSEGSLSSPDATSDDKINDLDAISKFSIANNSSTVQSSDKNSQLRESLLRVAREHYRSVKSAEALEVRVDELQTKLKFNERKNKQLSLELEELKILHNVDASEVKVDLTVLKVPQKGPVTDLVDERLDGILKRQAADPTDLLRQMRFMMSQLVEIPPTLILNDVSNHIVARELSKIFDCEFIILFLPHPHLKEHILKYSVRSPTPENIYIGESNCVAKRVLSTGNAIRNNNVAKFSLFNINIDSCPGIIPNKLMTLPVKNKMDDTILGAISFVNRFTTSNDFSEADELIADLYAQSIAPNLICCDLHNELKKKGTLLRSLLEASTSVYDAVPDHDSIAAHKSLTVVDILTTLEDIIKNTLKSTKCRAYLMSDALQSSVGFELDQLIFLERNEVKTMPVTSGIAGLVSRSQKSYRNHGGEGDDNLNPQVDLEPNEIEAMYTVPIADLNNRVVAIIQAIPGASSPKERLVNSKDTSDMITFSDSIIWLAHQFAPSLQYLINSLGRPASRPMSTPHRISSNSNLFDNSSTKAMTPSNSKRRTSSFSSATILEGNAATVTFSNVSSGFEIDPAEHEKIKSELSEANSKLADYSKSIESLHEKISGYSRALNIVNEEKGSLASDLKNCKDLLNSSKDENKRLEQQCNGYSQQFENYSQQITRLESELKANQEKLQSTMQLLESNGEQSAIIDEMNRASEQQIKDTAARYEQLLNKERESNSNMQIEIDNAKRRILSIESELTSAQSSLANAEKGLADKDTEIASYAALKYSMDDEILKYQTLHHQAESSNQTLQVEIQARCADIEDLRKQIAQKDMVTKILQDQLVSMAGDKMSDITEALNKVATSAAPQKTQPSSSTRGPPDSQPPSHRSNLNSAQGNRPHNSWEELADEYGQVYYFNRETGETSWSKPGEQQQSAPEPLKVGDWSRQYDSSGNEYWVNDVTGESAWEHPQMAAGGHDALSMLTNRTNGGQTGRSNHTTGGYTIEL